MPPKLVWSEPRDIRLKRMRSEGISWDTIADELGISRNAARERGRRVGARLPPADHVAPPEDVDRPPLPPGHPVSWGVLIEGTCLAGTPYDVLPSQPDVSLSIGLRL
jgi:hypothetical protein